MNEYVILSDSSCDLPAEMVEAMQLRILPLTVSIGGAEYADYPDERELSTERFYELLRSGLTAVTSAANAEAFFAEMAPILEGGKDILYIGFSSALSGTFQNAGIAAEELREKYPERTVLCMDSRCASMGQGLLLTLAVAAKNEGKSLQELKEYVEAVIPRLCHWFTVDDLHFLKRGGRISAATASVGTLLHIKPILHVDPEGRLVQMEKARGRKAAIEALSQKVAAYATEIETQTVMISHGDSPEDAEKLAQKIRERLRPAGIIIHTVGPVIGAHSGPGTLSVFFLGTQR